MQEELDPAGGSVRGDHVPHVAADAVEVTHETPAVIVFAAGCRQRLVAVAAAVRSCLARLSAFSSSDLAGAQPSPSA